MQPAATASRATGSAGHVSGADALALLRYMLEINLAKRASVNDGFAHPYLASIWDAQQEEDSMVSEEGSYEVAAATLVHLEFDVATRRHMSLDELRGLILAEVYEWHPEARPAAATPSVATPASSGLFVPAAVGAALAPTARRVPARARTGTCTCRARGCAMFAPAPAAMGRFPGQKDVGQNPRRSSCRWLTQWILQLQRTPSLSSTVSTDTGTSARPPQPPLLPGQAPVLTWTMAKTWMLCRHFKEGPGNLLEV